MLHYDWDDLFVLSSYEVDGGLVMAFLYLPGQTDMIRRSDVCDADDGSGGRFTRVNSEKQARNKRQPSTEAEEPAVATGY